MPLGARAAGAKCKLMFTRDKARKLLEKTRVESMRLVSLSLCCQFRIKVRAEGLEKAQQKLNFCHLTVLFFQPRFLSHLHSVRLFISLACHTAKRAPLRE